MFVDYNADNKGKCALERTSNVNTFVFSQRRVDFLHPIRTWLDRLEVRNEKTARFICSLIPAQCPFERTIALFGYTLVHIPSLCKLNPLYEELMLLRFRALCFLASTQS